MDGPLVGRVRKEVAMTPRDPRESKTGLQVPLWLILLVILLLVVPLAWSLFPRGGPLSETGYDPSSDRPLTVEYRERSWVPTAEAIRLPDESMRVVGEAEGYTLFAWDGSDDGGGAGASQVDAWEPPARDRIYLKVGDDRYLPMRWRNSTASP